MITGGYKGTIGIICSLWPDFNRLLADSRIDSTRRLYFFLVLIKILLQRINPGSTWHKRLFELLQSHHNVSRAHMGMPEDWANDPFRRLIVESFDREEYLLFSAFDDKGSSLDQETCEKMFACDGNVMSDINLPDKIQMRLDQEADRHAKATISRSIEKNNQHFNEGRNRLEKWADDMVFAAEKEVKDTKEQIKSLNRQTRLANTMDEQHQVQARIRTLEKKKRRQRQQIFDVEDEIMDKRDALITALEKRMAQKTDVRTLFIIQWKVV